MVHNAMGVDCWLKEQIRLNLYIIFLLDVSVYTNCLLVNLITLYIVTVTFLKEHILMKSIGEIKFCNIVIISLEFSRMPYRQYYTIRA
jgi:hypothetical protein